MTTVKCPVEDCKNKVGNYCNSVIIELDKTCTCMSYKVNMIEVRKHNGNK